MNAPHDPDAVRQLADLAERMMHVLVEMPGVPQDPDVPWATLNAYGVATAIAMAVRPALKASAPPGALADLDKLASAAAALLRKRLENETQS